MRFMEKLPFALPVILAEIMKLQKSDCDVIAQSFVIAMLIGNDHEIHIRQLLLSQINCDGKSVFSPSFAVIDSDGREQICSIQSHVRLH